MHCLILHLLFTIGLLLHKHRGGIISLDTPKILLNWCSDESACGHTRFIYAVSFHVLSHLFGKMAAISLIGCYIISDGCSPQC